MRTRWEMPRLLFWRGPIPKMAAKCSRHASHGLLQAQVVRENVNCPDPRGDTAWRSLRVSYLPAFLFGLAATWIDLSIALL